MLLDSARAVMHKKTISFYSNSFYSNSVREDQMDNKQQRIEERRGGERGVQQFETLSSVCVCVLQFMGQRQGESQW